MLKRALLERKTQLQAVNVDLCLKNGEVDKISEAELKQFLKDNFEQNFSGGVLSSLQSKRTTKMKRKTLSTVSLNIESIRQLYKDDRKSQKSYYKQALNIPASQALS